MREIKTLGDKLRLARENKGVTQMQVYKDLGINNKTLSGYEKNVSEPDLDTLSRLVEYYDYDINYFLNGKSNPKYPVAEKFIDGIKEKVEKFGYDLSDKSTEEIAKLIIKALKIEEINKGTD